MGDSDEEQDDTENEERDDGVENQCDHKLIVYLFTNSKQYYSDKTVFVYMVFFQESILLKFAKVGCSGGG